MFGLELGWLPVGGWNDGALANRVLPILVLSAPQIAAIARLTRAAMIDALASPSSRTLRAYGLGRRTILMHAFRAALLPLVSYLGPAAAALTTGSVVVETIFGIPASGAISSKRRSTATIPWRSAWRRPSSFSTSSSTSPIR